MPEFTRIPRDEIVRLANLGKQKVFPFFKTNMELTPRNPYNSLTGFISVQGPTDWDPSTNLISMRSSKDQSHPDKNTTRLSGIFRPESTGNHIMAVHFTGTNVTMTLEGPWGASTASIPASQALQTAAVVAIVLGTIGTPVSFTAWASVLGSGLCESQIGLVEAFN